MNNFKADIERRYTTEEVAKRLRCKPKTVTKWVREGRITAPVEERR